MRVLLLVDLQNDFMPGGSLAVPDGDSTVPLANKLMREGNFDLVVATKDWHPANHQSFALNHPGRNIYDQIQLGGVNQILWPSHCVQGSSGAEFHAGLDRSLIDRVITKGSSIAVDSYSGFFDNQKLVETELRSLIDSAGREKGLERNQIELFICGLATDYCVKATAVDAAELGYATSLIVDASRAVNLSAGDELQALRDVAGRGVQLVSSQELLPQRSREARQLELRP